MFVEAIKIAKQGMFPIFGIKQIDPQNAEVGVAGTGFFINDLGHFVSVAHVFDGAGPDMKHMYWGRLPDNLQSPALEITEVVRDEANDILIGKVNLTTTGLLLAEEMPEEGRSVCVSGYPMAVIQNNAQGGLELGGVRRYFQPSFVLDVAKCNSDNGSGTIRTHDGFLVRDVGLFGMSGGPVFDVNGTVVGIQGSVTPPRVSKGGNRTITTENAMVIRAPLVIELLKRNGIPFNEALVKSSKKKAKSSIKK